MPPRIHVLSETLANQIAAGEVIERPAAVVKELVENALDAGATRVEIELVEGGLRLVRVRDDGSGMSREDAQLSLQRHATSKLSTKEDLFAIASYGFRGEALPSIAAVSRFSLLTAEAGALGGTRVVVEGGTILSVEDAGAPPGTTVEVRDLFWNVPARRKFVKRPPTEHSHALEAVLRLALPRSDVAFTVRDGHRLVLSLPGGASLEGRAEEALGRELRGKLLPFRASVRGLRAHGLCGAPEVSWSNGRGIWLFVNGRAVRDRSLTHAVLHAYGEVLPHGRYPAAVVFLDVPPAEVDVNVHPAKSEVRLADPQAAHAAIHGALGAVLAPGAHLSLGAAQAAAAAPPLDERQSRVAEALAGFGERTGWALPAPDAPPAQVSLAAPRFFSALRYLGQLHRTYLVCEGPRGLVLVDQHAAHERMSYQRLRRLARDRAAPVQPLLVPRVIALPAPALPLLESAGPALAAIGLEIEPYGGGSVAVQTLPAPLRQASDPALAALLVDLADELASHGRSRTLDELQDALLARAACHASVRAHDALSDAEAQALLAALDDTDYGARCAHGRPVLADWPTVEIEKRFGRDYQAHAHAHPPEAI